MISHRNIVAIIAGGTARLDLTSTDFYLSYLPLAHVLERLVLGVAYYTGMCFGMYSGDVLKVKDDLAVLRPTLFASVPRLYNKFYDTIK
jgi:long-chain acyl-CoA synthetase